MTRIQLCLICSIHAVHCRAVLIYWLFTLSLEKKAHRDTEGPENQHASFSTILSKTAFCRVVLWTEYVFFTFMCYSPNCQRTVLWKGFCLFGTPWSTVYQNPLSIVFLRQKYWSGLLFPSPGNLPDPGIESRSLPLQADSLPSEPPEKPVKVEWALRVQHSSNRFSVSMKCNTREFSLLSLCLCVLSSVCLLHSPPCVRTHGETILERKSSYKNLTLLVPWSGVSSPQSCEEISFWCLFHWVHCILLCVLSWQIQNHLFWKFKKDNEWKEIHTVVALLWKLCDFTKLVLSSISTSYELMAFLT